MWDITEDNVYNRTYYVLQKLLEWIPPEARDHPMAQILTFAVRESKKDIRRIPEEFITQLANVIGEAFTWVSDGSMDDIHEMPEPEDVEKLMMQTSEH